MLTSRQAARWSNARQVWAKLINLQQQGYIIYDEHNERVGKFLLTDKGCYIEDSHTCRHILFEADPDFDHGLHTSITEWNNRFKNWSIVHPAYFKELAHALGIKAGRLTSSGFLMKPTVRVK